jgi:hypothetical protein
MELTRAYPNDFVSGFRSPPRSRAFVWERTAIKMRELGGFPMGRISTLFEVILSATLFILGLYLVYAGSSNKSTSALAFVTGGAFRFTLGLMTLTSAVRSILWHRRMVRHSLPSHSLGHAAPRNHRG